MRIALLELHPVVKCVCSMQTLSNPAGFAWILKVEVTVLAELEAQIEPLGS